MANKPATKRHKNHKSARPRTGPVFPLLFGLNMVLHTAEGDVFKMSQYKQWLKQAGFASIKTVEIESPSPLIVASR